MNKKICFLVTGPTAVGKTDYAIELAQKFHTEIISADSRQCYKELNIGVAKPTPVQLQKIHHYFIDSHSISEDVNAKVFESYALNTMESIFQMNEFVVVVGGTGLYIKALCEGLDSIPESDEVVRKYVHESYLKFGLSWLQNEIEKRDPLYFSSGEIHNPQRSMRALEVKMSTGISILEFQSGKKVARDFQIRQIHLDLPREQLYKRINNRVDAMLNTGLLKEAEQLFPYRQLNALQTVGYRELFAFLEGKISYEKAVEEIKKNTRHYAKRQVTWFRKFEFGRDIT
jgi:tRNA dimethylallyltransferase